MFFAYVLKSIEHNYFYKGHCKNLTTRLQQHNSGMTESIRPYILLKWFILKSLIQKGKQLK